MNKNPTTTTVKTPATNFTGDVWVALRGVLDQDSAAMDAREALKVMIKP